MKFLSNTFLYKVFAADKLLFSLFAFYMVMVLVFAAKQREEFPFLLYGMYSLKETQKPAYVTYQIFIDGKLIETTKLKDAKAELITSPLLHVASARENGEKKTLNLELYREWLTHYADIGKELTIYKITCAYNPNGVPQIISKELIYGKL